MSTAIEAQGNRSDARLNEPATGTVWVYWRGNGVGKIKHDDGRGVRFHINDVINAKVVNRDQRVRFVLQRDSRPGKSRLEARRIFVEES